MRRNNWVRLLPGVFLFFAFCCVSAENSITVSCGKNTGNVNRKILGSNLLGYDPATYENWTLEFYGYSDFGAGCFDPVKQKPVEDVIKLCRNAGIKTLRFPGGCGSHTYDWKKTVGKNRKQFLFGLDEFLQVCEKVQAEPIITLSYFTGIPSDAVDMVEYLNAPVSVAHPWALKRSENGHPESYKAKYFEVGNEVYHGNHRDIKKVEPEEYAEEYLKFYNVLKRKDPSVQIGVVLYEPMWNQKVAEIIKDRADFGIIHTYPTPAWAERLETMPSKEIFEVSFAIAMIRDDFTFKDILNLFKETAGKKLPLAVTEFNGGFIQEKPVPYRFTLGCALVNAELMNVFMKPENNIVMADYWQFCNSYFGSVANNFSDNPMDLYNSYYKRPNYYPFEMYHKHFGDELLELRVECGTYDISRYDWFKKLMDANLKGVVSGGNLLSGQWNIQKLFGVKVREQGIDYPAKPGNDSILEVNSGLKSKNENCLQIIFKNPWEKNYCHSYQEAAVEPNTFYKLSAFIKTDKFFSDRGINLGVQDARGWKATHSAAGTKPLLGTNDWTYTETLYLTLPDAKGVKVIARNVGYKKSLKGTVYFKDVKLEKFVPVTDGKIPYLSVNASKSKDRKKLYLMVLNKNLENPVSAAIRLKDFTPASSAQVWTLNGPEVISTNEQNHDNVCITSKTLQIPGADFNFTFEPHSLTSIEISAG